MSDSIDGVRITTIWYQSYSPRSAARSEIQGKGWCSQEGRNTNPRLIGREGTTALQKPSVQTRQLLTAMDDQAKQVHEKLSEILARFDHQVTLIEKMGQEMKQLGQQVEITQEAMDEVKKKQSEWNLAPPLPPHPPSMPTFLASTSRIGMPSEGNLGTTMTNPGILANHQPPILAPSPAPNLTPQGMDTQTTIPEEERFFRPPRHDFPKF